MNNLPISVLVSLASNLIFSAYHLVVGLVTGSWWLLTLFFYYLLLSVLRFAVLMSKGSDRFIGRFTGRMLILMSIPLVGRVILSVVRHRGHELHMILMIAMAAYTFTRITLATIQLINARRSSSARLVLLRNISFADALVSIFALQRSMLVSFEGMTEREIVIMNLALGSAVSIACLLLGIMTLIKNQGNSTDSGRPHKFTPSHDPI